jgi:hypothetical protein
MNIEQFLKKDIFQFPYSYAENYTTRVSNILDEYLDDINNLNIDFIDIEKLKKDCKKISHGIEESLDKYLAGCSFESHKIVFDLLDTFKEYYLNDVFVTKIPVKFNGLYKIRNIEKNIIECSCSDNFIIPYENYNLIGTHRFSIPGFPCLYLGTSSYVCSHEIPKIKSKNQIISRYELWDSVLNNILYLFYRPNDIMNILIDNRLKDFFPDIINSYLRLLPFLLVIYHKVQKEEGPFRPEYILSQILMQWVRINNVDGICYLSTKVDYSLIDKGLGLNFAFPSPIDDLGFSKHNDFMHKFYLSKPMKLNNKITKLHFNENRDRLLFVDDNGRSNTILPNRMLNGQNYWTSYYGKIDHLLQNAKNYNTSDKYFKTKYNIEDFEYCMKPSWL